MPNWVIRSDRLTGAEKLVYIALLNRANNEGKCWPSLATLQRDANVSKNTALKALDDLQRKSLITKVRRVKPGAGSDMTSVNDTNLYQVHAWRGGSETEPGVVQPVNQGGSNGDQEVLPNEVLPNVYPKKSRRSQEIPLADTWSPSDAHVRYARENNLDLAHEVHQFRAHALANDRRQRNWNGSFSQWLGNAKKWGRVTETPRKVKVFNDEVD